MILRAIRRLWLVLSAICLSAHSAASADRFETFANRQARQDAHDLASLAPPARTSTARATYGDALLARVRARNRSVFPARELGASAPVGLYFCRTSEGTKRDLCMRDPRRTGFRHLYVYTPAYATAPQVRRDGRDAESSLLAPSTRFFYAANAYLFGNREDDQGRD